MALARAAHDYDTAIREGELAVTDALGDDRLRGDLARLYIRRAGLRYRRRDPGGAEDDLQSALELRPGLAERFRARVILGDLALARRDLAAAASEYGQALEIAQATGAHVPEIHLRMARVLMSLGDVSHARDELDRAVRECDEPVRRDQMEAMRRSLTRGR
jgi:tetratricopeptide (TPR) repeat protein